MVERSILPVRLHERLRQIAERNAAPGGIFVRRLIDEYRFTCVAWVIATGLFIYISLDAGVF